MDEAKLKKELEFDERRCTRIYTDTVGKISGGVGRNLSDRGFTESEVDFMLANDVRDTIAELDRNVPWYKQMTDARQRVFANMSFNMGIKKFLKFEHMIAAAKAGDYEKASREMLDSLWAKQVKGRADRLAKMMQEG